MTTLFTDRVVEAVATDYGLKPEEISGRCGERHLVIARAMVVLLLRQLTDMSLEAIGKVLEGRTFRSALRLQRKAQDRLEAHVGFRERHTRIFAALYPPPEFQKSAPLAGSALPPSETPPAKKPREGGVYFIKRGMDQTWEGSCNGWGDVPDDHGRIEWTDRAEAVGALTALRVLAKLEGDEEKIALMWSRRSKNRDLPHYAMVNEF